MNKHTAINILRETLKSGPLGEAYSQVRRIKRRVFDKPIPEQEGQYALPPEILIAQAANLLDEPRLYFSLALRYLDAESPGALRKALASLRCAHALDHPSPERIALYRALSATRRGLPHADALMRDLPSYELTPEENVLRQEILAGPAVAPPSEAQSNWQGLADRVAQTGAASVVVVGDVEAISADWLPDARYLLVAPPVTGLTPDSAVCAGREWQLGIGSATERERLHSAGVSCAQWLNIEKW